MATAQEEWDFYVCLIDDEPGAILVDLAWRAREADKANSYLHIGYLHMREGGSDGMGTPAEAERLGPIEDQLFERARAAGAVPVGHVRSDDVWQLCVYGPADLPWPQWVAETLPNESGHAGKDDPEWVYYWQFLLPDAERLQWIMDRRVCDKLEQHGDQLEIPRPIDHWVDFGSEVPAAFVAETEAMGFVTRTEGTSVQLVRDDAVDLHVIHEVVMTLVEVAQRHGGTYDGWGCGVVQN